MSHLAHIVKLKAALIVEGIADPYKQIDIVQTAYIKALINVNGANNLDEKTCVGFNQWILSYWNEVTPVKGNLIAVKVGSFFRGMTDIFNKAITGDVVILPVVDKVETPEGTDYLKLEEYESLIATLIYEANHKLSQYVETQQIA